MNSAFDCPLPQLDKRVHTAQRRVQPLLSPFAHMPLVCLNPQICIFRYVSMVLEHTDLYFSYTSVLFEHTDLYFSYTSVLLDPRDLYFGCICAD